MVTWEKSCNKSTTGFLPFECGSWRQETAAFPRFLLRIWICNHFWLSLAKLMKDCWAFKVEWPYRCVKLLAYWRESEREMISTYLWKSFVSHRIYRYIHHACILACNVELTQVESNLHLGLSTDKAKKNRQECDRQPNEKNRRKLLPTSSMLYCKSNAILLFMSGVRQYTEGT